MTDAAIRPEHPRQKLLFFIPEEVSDEISHLARDLVWRLASQRSWLNGPPRFANSRQPSEGKSIHTLGGYLEIYSAFPPRTLPHEVDVQLFEEVSDLVKALCEFSREHSLTIELELDQEFVGAVQNGEMDEMLAEDLLGEWKRHLRR